ncbi:MAG: PorV/PorQ family protein [Gemmatimonadales bacterium]
MGAAPGSAQTTRDEGALFLLIPVGARAAALGQAAVSDRGTAEAAFWNPAGLAALPRSEFAFHAARTFASSNGVISAYFQDDRVGTVGAAAYVVDLGSQDFIPRGATEPTGRTTTRNIELIASYATSLGGDLSLGVNYKLIQLRNDCSGDCGTFRAIVGTTHAMDIGLQGQVAQRFEYGIAVRHAGFKLQLENSSQADPLPTRVVVGASWTMPVSRLADGTGLDARFLVNLQDAVGQYASPDVLVGSEIGYGDLLRVRAGYAFTDAGIGGATIGIGFRYERFMVDFARLFYDSAIESEPAYLSIRVWL